MHANQVGPQFLCCSIQLGGALDAGKPTSHARFLVSLWCKDWMMAWTDHNYLQSQPLCVWYENKEPGKIWRLSCDVLQARPPGFLYVCNYQHFLCRLKVKLAIMIIVISRKWTLLKIFGSDSFAQRPIRGMEVDLLNARCRYNQVRGSDVDRLTTPTRGV